MLLTKGSWAGVKARPLVNLMIRGITLTHPWPYFIAHGGKTVENRTWRPERQGGHVGMWLAIHGGVIPKPNTGKREEARQDLWAALRMAHTAQARAAEAGLPAVKLPDHSESDMLSWSMGLPVEGEDQFFIAGIVAIAQVLQVTQRSTSPFAVNDLTGRIWHWDLCNITVLPEPIPHRGAQGLWEVQPEVLAQLRETYKAAKK